MKKLFSLLLIPILAVPMFTGCSKNKSIKEIQEYYNEIAESYFVGDENAKTSNIFFKTNVLDDDNKVLYTTYEFNIKYTGKLGAGLASFDDLFSVQIDKDISSKDENLYYRYYALKYVIEPILDKTMNYYVNWQDNMYYGLELVKADVEKKDLSTLYEKMEKWAESVSLFSVAKQKIEDDVDVLTFDGAIRSNLTTYTNSCCKLIESSFDFVNYFKDMHFKYVWKNNNYSAENKSSISVINRMIDEAYLSLSQLVYYEYIKSFINADCDLSDLIKYCKNNIGDDDNSIVNGIKFLSNAITPKTNTTTIANSGEIYTNYIAGEKVAVESFIYSMNAFNKKFGIYKTVYEKLDYYKINQVRFGNNNGSDYVANLSTLDNSNYELLKSFTDETAKQYFTELKNLIDFTFKTSTTA